MTIYNAIRGQPVDLGRQGEHLARRVVFDISDWVRDFGAGTVRLLHQRQEDAAPYPVTITRTDADGITENPETGTLVLWDVSAADAATRQRYGRAELRYYSVGDGGASFLAKSETYQTFVADALGAAVEDIPDPTRDWIQTLLSQTDEVGERFDALDDAFSEVHNALESVNDALESAEAQAQSAAEISSVVYETFCQTASGDPCEFIADKSASLQSLVVHITPTQSGTPSVANPVRIAGYDSVRIFLTANQLITLNFNGGRILDDGISIADEERVDRYWIYTGFIPYLPSKTYRLSVISKSDFLSNFKAYFFDENRTLLGVTSGKTANNAMFNFAGGVAHLYSTALIQSGPAAAREIRLNIENIYSNSGEDWDALYLADTQSDMAIMRGERRADAYEIPLGAAGTVYGGTLDVISGGLIVTHDCIESYQGETVPDGWISSTGQLSTGAQVVYPLATPRVFQLALHSFSAVSGYNAIYSDAGSVDIVRWVDSVTREELNSGLAGKVSKTSAGSAINGIYLDENGEPAAMTHSLESDVPPDAVFTDTTYQNATSSAAGLMSAADKTKLDGIETGAQTNLIESVSVNGTAAPINNKAVAISTLTQSDVQSLINDALADFTGVSFLPVNALPASGESGVFYLVPNGASAQNAYDEYIWIASANRFEKIGTTEIDLSGYAHTADIPTKTSDLTNDSGFITTQDIAGKQDSASQEAIDAAQNSRLTAVESENALLRELISGIDAPIYRTTSGNPATFNDGYDNAALRNLTVTIIPTQSGSGDPSPDNVRPIVGYASVTATRTGAESANLQTVTVTLTDGTDPLAVYGGTLDMISGTLTVTHGIYTFTGNETWMYSSTTRTFFSQTATLLGCVPHLYTETFQGICDGLASYDGATPWADVTVPTIGVGTSSSSRNTGLRLKIPSASNQADVRTVTAGFRVVYPLATPVSYQLTPVSLTSLQGYNSVTANVGTLSVTYRADPSISLGG